MLSLTTPEAGWKKEESVKDWANKKKVSKGQSKKTVQSSFSIPEISNMGPDAMFKYHGNPLFLGDLLLLQMDSFG